MIVSHNNFTMNTAKIRGCTTKNLCGYMGLLAFNAGVPTLMQFFHAYPALVARANGGLGNVWSANSYTWNGTGALGTYGFWAGNQGTALTWQQWRDAPYGQDAGQSTGNSAGELIPPRTPLNRRSAAKTRKNLSDERRPKVSGW